MTNSSGGVVPTAETNSHSPDRSGEVDCWALTLQSVAASAIAATTDMAIIFRLILHLLCPGTRIPSMCRVSFLRLPRRVSSWRRQVAPGGVEPIPAISRRDGVSLGGEQSSVPVWTRHFRSAGLEKHPRAFPNSHR